MTTAISGIWTAMITPIGSDNNIDSGKLGQHAHALMSQCDGIVLFGSTGEAPSFSDAERTAALESLLGSGIEAARVVVGTGCPSLPATVELTKHALSHDVAGVLVVPPFYFKGVAEEGILSYYEDLIEQVGSGLRLYLYHFPKLSGVPLSVSVVASLKERFPETVLGIKDSTGDFDSVEAFLTIEDLAVFPGTERILVEAKQAGAAGVITASGNVNAPSISTVWNEGTGVNNMLAIRTAVEQAGTIVGSKAYLAHRYNDESWNRVRAPFVSLNQTQQDGLVESLKSLMAENSLQS